MWIDFEGIDGCGKTSLSLGVVRRLREHGFGVVHPREQGAFRSRLAGSVRDLTRDVQSLRLTPDAEFLLGAAREAQLLAEEIRPALGRNRIVVTDRAMHAHVARAAFVHGLPYRLTDGVAEFVARGLWPDVIVFVDVEPDLARMRRRLRKIRERRLGTCSRKGLVGEAAAERMRQAFRLMAVEEPGRWRVLDNSWRTQEEAEAAAWSLVAPALALPCEPSRPAPPARCVEPGPTLAAWAAHFFDFVESIVDRDPGLAALWSAGIEDPRADGIRRAAADRDPGVAAWSTVGLSGLSAWDVRRQTREAAPDLVARSLMGLDVPLAWTWRLELAAVAPRDVLHSERGMCRAAAHQLRETLWDQETEEALRSLAGLDDPQSWGLRARAMLDDPTGALAESVEGVDAAPAWKVREELKDGFPFSVLRSVRGLRRDPAWEIRRELARCAPRAVLETVHGMDGPSCSELRNELRERCPDEVASSLAGLETPEAWRHRRELEETAPVGVMESLQGLEGHPAAVELAERILSRSGGRPRLARKAALFQGARMRGAL